MTLVVDSLALLGGTFPRQTLENLETGISRFSESFIDETNIETTDSTFVKPTEPSPTEPPESQLPLIVALKASQRKVSERLPLGRAYLYRSCKSDNSSASAPILTTNLKFLSKRNPIGQVQLKRKSYRQKLKPNETTKYYETRLQKRLSNVTRKRTKKI